MLTNHTLEYLLCICHRRLCFFHSLSASVFWQEQTSLFPFHHEWRNLWNQSCEERKPYSKGMYGALFK